MTDLDDLSATVEAAKLRIIDLRQRNDELLDALKGMVGLVQLVQGRDDVSPALRDVLRLNHRVSAALGAILKAEARPL
jgi:hypothetical protein